MKRFTWPLIAILLTVSYAYAATESYRVGITDYGVNILGNWNGTTCDTTGTNDSHACIQAAIDHCFGLGTACRNTFCPDGRYITSLPIFVDPPGNLRGADGTNGQTYTAGSTYTVGQTVNYSGVPYISLINSNTGNTPPSSPTDWQPFNYNAGTTYAINAIVSYGGVPWISLQNSNTGNTPSTSSAFWQLSVTTQYTGQFSASFYGNLGQYNANTTGGCDIRPSFANGCVFWMGSGQGMTLANVNINQNTNSSQRGTLPPTGVGVCNSGGLNGASRTLVQNVGVNSLYTCFKTGVNVDGLGDSNRWVTTTCSNAYYCIYVSETQKQG